MKAFMWVLAVAVVFSASLWAQPFIADSNTVALWHFDESNGSLAIDSSLHHNNGTAYGTTIVAGRFGNARYYNGAGDYVDVPNPADGSLDFGSTQSFTIEAWFKTTQATTGEILRRGLAPLPGYMLRVLNGQVQGVIGDREDMPPPSMLLRVTSTAFYNDDNWHHAVLVRDRSQSKLYLYVDEVQAAPPLNDNFTLPISSNRPLTIGRWETVPTYFRGTIDEVRILRGARHPGNFGTAYPFIFISDNGGRSDSLEFGTAPGATDGIDSLLGESELPPVPPLTAFDARWQITGTQGAKRDIRDTLGGARTQVTHTGLMQPGSGGYPFYLRWKRQELPVGTFTLRYGSDSVNMQQLDSLVITNPDVVSFRIVHDRRTTLYDTTQQGWNIVSLPLAVADRRKASVFPVSASHAFAYTQLGYARRDTLDYGFGYWLKFSAVQPLSMIGDPQNLDTIDVDAGWNLIGSVSSPVDTGSVVQIPNGIVASQYYGYNGTMYTVPSTIEPFHGYWVKANQPGKLVLSGTGFLLGKTPVNRSNVITEAARLRLIDQFGNSQEVFFTSNDVSNPDYYELPPLPPTGIFDARFSTNRMLEAVREGESKTILIRVSYAQYPLTISWDMKDQSLKGSLVVGTKEVAMNGVGSVKVADANASLALRLGGNSSVPKEFALAQNYPNPFNPSTTIKYDVPTDTRVSLKLFNMLGQEVLTLVNEEQKAGYKSIEWNASNVASGVYFYRLISGSFVETRRMLLLR